MFAKHGGTTVGIHGLVYGEQHRGLLSCAVWQRRIYASLVLSFERTMGQVRGGALAVRQRMVELRVERMTAA